MIAENRLSTSSVEAHHEFGSPIKNIVIKINKKKLHDQ
jgi:hypothetical protein